MKIKTIDFIKNNLFTLLYVGCSLIIELLAVLITSQKLFIAHPWMFFTVLVAGILILSAIRSQKIRLIVSSSFLILHAVICLVCVVVYTRTAGSVFDFAMLYLIGDGMGTVDSIKPNFWFLFPVILIVSAYVVVGARIHKKLPKLARSRFFETATLFFLCFTLVLQGVISYGINSKKEDYVQSILYRKAENNYTYQGVLGNFVSQLYKGAFYNTVDLGDTDELNSFIYDGYTTPTAPVSAAGYNTVFILCESFEWFSFISDTEKYPKGIDASESVLRELFPNLYGFYDSSYVMTNYYAREKTDVVENHSLLGCYPDDLYINYNTTKNAYPFSVTNVLNSLYNVKSNYYHDGVGNFYNRSNFFKDGIGFNDVITTEQLVEKSGESGIFTDYTNLGEKNLDSEMFELCKEEMFPTDRRFNTHITTITMHGQYTERENLKPYYDLLDEKGVCPAPEDNDPDKEYKNYLRTYVAAALDFEKALGIMNEYLIANNLYDNTMVVLFADHNAYYHDLTNYVKDIPENKSLENYTELYRLPFMIRVGNNQGEVIDKFTCSTDILPTVYDLLGIKYFNNMFFGHSVFSVIESVLYSRVYKEFIASKVYFYSLNNIIYKAPDADEAYMYQIVDLSTELIVKLEHINRVFYNDFFKGIRGDTFTETLVAIN